MSVSDPVQLPEGFADLDEFVARWCNDSMAEQYAARLDSTVAEMQPFYEAVKGRIEEIKAYLDGIAFEDYTDSDAALGRLAIGWVPVAEAIEVFKQTRVPDSKGYWELVQEPQSF